MLEGYRKPNPMRTRGSRRLALVALVSMVGSALLWLSSCSGSDEKRVQASAPAITVGVTKVVKKSLGRRLTLSSELVPFEEIDVYAKESGYVKKL
jgi:multidrug efflux pump subunit AcrA (membrane-fusion protein)